MPGLMGVPSGRLVTNRELGDTGLEGGVERRRKADVERSRWDFTDRTGLKDMGAT